MIIPKLLTASSDAGDGDARVGAAAADPEGALAVVGAAVGAADGAADEARHGRARGGALAPPARPHARRVRGRARHVGAAAWKQGKRLEVAGFDHLPCQEIQIWQFQ